MIFSVFSVSSVVNTFPVFPVFPVVNAFSNSYSTDPGGSWTRPYNVNAGEAELLFIAQD